MHLDMCAYSSVCLSTCTISVMNILPFAKKKVLSTNFAKEVANGARLLNNTSTRPTCVHSLCFPRLLLVALQIHDKNFHKITLQEYQPNIMEYEYLCISFSSNFYRVTNIILLFICFFFFYFICV